ncbi:glycoside hydrolase family 35 protein [Cellulomonas fimi]|uniref:Beta-galactosidase n=1 Tax=Cellulomonas fimi (strain ATCC 484 / DSM 20113 / JCM 1341 / CCUG 24087 / LMG 16345 / NBRC 15513 / NCIMB 8980 / NCTC 7547 / NRS-133) TaxID=590998 RepID=F4H3R6_CELFA|nr:beta-galactosidase family protein [Cellulomonas fimi]AEE47732.1 Beta-galactosidase [Cellulomonas fimi ATCC 484]NNH06730.1 beta-galactosidase [Cellulomonas fimi]VEH36891.1 Beta-galactosidase precursor [Cellulomonas fimi]
MSRFEIGEQDFLHDGTPVRILSGALHYFRHHPDQWRDRLTRARELGLNTIETYIPWNAHSPARGEFRTDGILDLGRFLDEVAAQGMWAIVRPGPYICAEWTGGGLPGWLFTAGAAVRRHEPTYLAAIQDYYEAVAGIVAPRQVDRGGPVVLVQVENEYGAYGDDKDYLRALVKLLRESGITTPLTTIDQPEPWMLENGSLPELHKTGSFGSRAAERLATLREHQPTGPLMCAEFWDGWFDSWGLHHHTTDAAASAHELDTLLAAGASVNLYMVCGGTNFGFTNGANDKGTYVPIVTSYDYDAPLDEAGRPTAKYWAFREVLSRYTDVPAVTAPPRTDAPAFTAPLTTVAPLWDVLDLLGPEHPHDHLPTVDELGRFDGFALYRALDDVAPGVLDVAEVRDRAQVFVDRAPVAVLSRDLGEHRAVLPHGGALEVLVEDQGRVNYGPRIGEPKGLIGPARVGAEAVTRWGVRPLALDDVTALTAHVRDAAPVDGVVAGPAFAHATFDTPDPDADHFLDTAGWGKGVVWVNGFCLGRFWSRAPQRTLYVPAPVLRAQGNDILVLVLDTAAPTVTFVEDLALGHTEE